jgi:hypothetical protein
VPNPFLRDLARFHKILTGCRDKPQWGLEEAPLWFDTWVPSADFCKRARTPKKWHVAPGTSNSQIKSCVSGGAVHRNDDEANVRGTCPNARGHRNWHWLWLLPIRVPTHSQSIIRVDAETLMSIHGCRDPHDNTPRTVQWAHMKSCGHRFYIERFAFHAGSILPRVLRILLEECCRYQVSDSNLAHTKTIARATSGRGGGHHDGAPKWTRVRPSRIHAGQLPRTFFSVNLDIARSRTCPIWFPQAGAGFPEGPSKPEQLRRPFDTPNEHHPACSNPPTPRCV